MRHVTHYTLHIFFGRGGGNIILEFEVPSFYGLEVRMFNIFFWKRLIK